MNMISTGSFLTETGASNKQSELVKKLTAAWEKKNSKTARAGGASLMALSLAACGGEDNTPFSQADVDAAKAEGVASVDITSDNAEAMTSNDAEIAAAAKTEALTAADGTIYATVDAAYTAGSNLSNADAVTAALTGTDGTVYASVDAAVTAGADGVDITTDNQAAIDAEMAGTGFDNVAALLAAYNDAIAATPALTAALTTETDVVYGTSNNDTVTGTSSTYEAGDVIVDGSSSDSDTLTVTATNDISAKPTVAGFETVVYNLDASSTTTGTTFAIATDNVDADKIVVDVVKVGSTVTAASLTAVATGTTVESDLTLSVAGVANADLTIDATKATSQTIAAVTGTTDDLTINGSAATLLTVTDADAEENITITNVGGVTVTDLTAATDTLSTLTINAGGAVTITDSNNKGTIDITTSTGNITIGASDLDATGNITATTSNGNITVTNADDSTKTLTLTAVGDGNSNVTGADGSVTVTSADAALTGVITASDLINIDSMDAATTLTLSAGANSTLDGVSAVSTLTLSNTASTGITYTAGTGSDELNAVNNIVFAGSGDTTLVVDLTDLEAANADTSGGTSAAAVIATDNSTGTSRITLAESIAALTNSATLDLSALAVDEIALGADSTIGTAEVLKFASGANIVIASDQTSLNMTSNAVAGNTLTITAEDNSTASDTDSYEFGDITLTNIATLTIDAQDTERELTGDDNGTATNLADDTGLKVDVGTGAVLMKGAGSANIDEVVAASFNASQSSGNIKFTLDEDEVLAVTTGSGNDTLTDSDGNAAPAYVLDGGDGVDTFVAAAVDYSGVAFSMTNIEKIDVTAGDATFLDTQMTGKTLVVVADNAADELKINTGTTGGTIDATNIDTVTASLTITGGAGADTLTGSATAASTINAAGGGDVINAGNGGSTIDAAGGNDVVTTGTGTDSVTVGDGTDTVTIVADTSVDTVVFDSLTGQNTVNGFDTAEDKINLDSLGAVANIANKVGVTSGSVTAGAITDNEAYVISDGATALTAAGTQTIADYTDLTDVAAYLNEGYNATASADEGQFLINDLVGAKSYLYHFLEASGGASTISSAELTLVAVITEESGSALAVTDIV